MSDFKTNLVQSADAAARVGVLFVAVAMFAAMWESDSPPSSSDDHWLARRAGVADSVTVINRSELDSVDQSASQADLVSLVNPVALRSTASSLYPIPAGIVPGEYRVVDSFGMTDVLRVAKEIVSMQKSQKTCDQYVIEDGDRKIFFIRIQDRPAIVGARSGAVLR